jgi:hypothetical protein
VILTEQQGLSIVLITNEEGTPAGVGFLINGRCVVTAAHTVRCALLPHPGFLKKALPTPQDKPVSQVLLSFPFSEDKTKRTARVVCWYPEAVEKDNIIGDIAILQFSGDDLVRRKILTVSA